MIFALAGNQNCGKTTLFNALTGSNQHVGNFPGVTVDQKSGEVRGHKDCTVVDLPGIYSLRTYTQEELVTRDYILNQKPDGIINIVDATNIERNLYLTLQLLELRVPMVLALNMMDEVRANGGTIDVQKMSQALGIPVIPISAANGEGVSELVDQALAAARERLRLREAILTEWNNLPEERTLEQADYGDMIRSLGRQLRQETAAQEAQRQDMLDYYTTWVHQIKTPMAVMKLYLGSESPEHRAMGAELFRMEQYVDMVLQYLRLSSGENDLVIREYKLDELIREAVRKYAAQFVLKKLRLTYIPTEISVVTDRKWFGCILEQLLSNAIKYTPAGGSIAICVEEDALHISDTGIGIAPEDLPRIFEKGFTGYNGRSDKKASGIGLYLCRRICANLGHGISAQSVPGQGTLIRLDLRQREKVYE